MSAHGCSAAAAHSPAHSETQFVSGGARSEEFLALDQQANAYTLKLHFASRGSGAYLADVATTVQSKPTMQVVIDMQANGPLLLAKLPPGRYLVTARYNDVLPGSTTQTTRSLVVPRTGMVSSVIYFNTGDKVGDK